jgi:hypothetical protein
MTMLRMFWDAVRQIDPGNEGERRLAGTVEGDLVARFEGAGLENLVGSVLTASANYAGFDDFWEGFTLGIGPAGHYLASLSGSDRARVRAACQAELPDGPFSLEARAWCAHGAVPAP